MKRAICLLLLVLMTAAMLCACEPTFTCDICYEEKTGEQFQAPLLGRTVNMCAECKADYDELRELFGY